MSLANAIPSPVITNDAGGNSAVAIPALSQLGAPAKEPASPKRASFQPPARVPPRSPLLLARQPSPRNIAHAENTDNSAAKSTALASSSPTLSPRDAATTSGRHTPEKGKEEGKGQDKAEGELPQGSAAPAEPGRVRSDSSPAKLASPSKPPRPLSRAPQELTALPDSLSPPASPSTTAKKPSRPASRAPMELTPLNLAALKMPPSSTAPVPGSAPQNSPVKSPRNSARVRVFDALSGSSSAPTTPRKPSRKKDEFQPSSQRSRIDAMLQPAPSPRNMDQGLLEISEEIATLCVSELKLTHPVPKASVISALFRQDMPIRSEQLSAKVKSRLKLDETTTIISHRQLIRSLHLPAFKQSAAGKALLEFRQDVMETYGGVDPLTIRQMNAKEEKTPGYRKMQEQNMEPQAQGVAEAAFGKQPDLATSGLPPELIAQWKAMDRELCAWNSNAAARFNLAYDILLTSLILPVVTGDARDSGLAVPLIFYDAVKKACAPVLPAFVDSFIRVVDAERAAASASAAPTHTASTGGGSTTTGGADASSQTM